MSSSSSSWLTSSSCSPLSVDSSSPTSQLVAQWLRFIFLSPCPQRLLLSAIDLIFLITLLAFAAQKIYSRFSSNANSGSTITKPLLQDKDSDYKVTLWFKLPLLVTSLLALTYTVLSILAFTQSNLASWRQIEALFRLAQAITNIVIVILMVHEKKFKAPKHPLSLRFYWIANFVAAFLFATSAIIRLVSVEESSLEANLRVDDVFSFINLAVSLFLLVIAIKGSSGIDAIRISDVIESSRTWLSNDRTTSLYGNASLFSKTVWLWMNPLLNKGYTTPLKLQDVPTLPLEFRAERMSELFQEYWPKPEENSKHPVGFTLLRCFWKHIAFTGFLAVVRLAVMYIGPMLIQSFVDFTSKANPSPYEGLVLISILLVAKSIEVLSVHQFNFHSQKLGMLIRSSIITSVYKKGLRLSSTARQAHGTGQIVNHMAVDAQQLSDLMLQLHPIWLMPLQVAAALALIYTYVGLSAVAALLGTAVVFVFTLIRTKKSNSFQFRIMMSRDLRMKAINELLNNMRVIKFQAWEDYFGNKIRQFRQAEHGWIGKFLYYFAVNMAILSTAPLLVTVLTFGTATFLGIPLNAGTVFTITSVIKILQEPVRTFPQALMLISQAMVSLGRLDEFMMSKERDENAVQRDDKCESDIAVEMKDAKFSWDDEEGNEALKVEELEIRRGDHAAVVGTVGSGKSSLLASVLGEMYKISGKVRVCGTVAYVAQTSWIQNATIQENILFGLPMNQKKYKEVIRVCCLDKDLEMMEHGDQTEIGERGINLSGGQKQRVQLARAVYQDCDIYLLDDIFSAVDAQTGSFIFKKYYIASSRELTRLDSITKAPVIHHFSETISGVMTIRGFRKQGAFCQENLDRVNASLRMDFHNNGANEWLGFRLDFTGVVFLCIATVFMIFLPSAIIRPEYVGLSLSYGLALSSLLSFTISMTCSVENKMVSVERIKQFTNLPSEAPWTIPERTPPQDWPSHGNIELDNLQVRYRSNTPLVLKGVSLTIQGGEKIGVVGRTGSGKSTLIQVLFRLIEPSAGKIIIDGINICNVGLHDLRSRFGIIPQEPVLFQGTVRSNIDPLGLYSDEEIWKTENYCSLTNFELISLFLHYFIVVDGGDNWSVGQRQLLCLGRIMLKHSRILFMDEATASVDSQTDAVIQKIIREDFADRTIISIAHRIPTVMDCDRVLVIDAGMSKDLYLLCFVHK
ncbi:hypothetical protein Ahy_B04g070294 isoform L [Arachis hypogaea]|uniref:ABC-type xenobiotic transporter n=1 Tax=Arachis hypogaea TaxID=3818 RepID=A0A444ZG45_ARAHY|nr:hypothetical protein Ahy_B04g070294 isoform L [Arachis hypogaea]